MKLETPVFLHPKSCLGFLILTTQKRSLADVSEETVVRATRAWAPCCAHVLGHVKPCTTRARVRTYTLAHGLFRCELVAASFFFLFPFFLFFGESVFASRRFVFASSPVGWGDPSVTRCSPAPCARSAAATPSRERPVPSVSCRADDSPASPPRVAQCVASLPSAGLASLWTGNF